MTKGDHKGLPRAQPRRVQTGKAGLRTWIEIDTKALAHNYRLFRGLVGKGVKLMPIAKSNAYGHSIHDYALFMERAGADWIGVDSIIEGLALRERGVRKPILVLGYTLPERFADAAKHNISVTISSFESLLKIGTLSNSLKIKNWKLKIHAKVDTGMHRQGFLPEDMPKVLSILKKAPSRVVVEGLYTHLAGKDPHDSRENKEQLALFGEVVGLFRQAGFSPLVHAAATWGTLAYPDAHYDMVRPGMGLFGYFPSPDIEKKFVKKFPLRPALTWKTIVSEIKVLPRGGGVGYEFTEVLPPGSRIGICPIGYWHGYPRALSSKAFVLVCGKRAKVVGRVSMDMISIDLTKIPAAEAGDEVVLVGKQGKENISANELGALAGTSCYEILTRINPLIHRIYK